MPDVRAQGSMLEVMSEEKLQKLIKLLSSPNDGEVVAAARAILRTLEADGADIHELADRVGGRKLSQAEMQIGSTSEPSARGKDAAAADSGFHNTEGPSFHEMACEIQQKANGRLTPKEQDFVDDMVRWCARREPSEKQAKWLHAIYCQIGTTPMIEKPQTFNGDLAHLPAALAPLCQQQRWVVWRGSGARPRAAANGPSHHARRADPSRYARSNDPSTWGSYADAVAAVAAGKADGIGYMLSTSDIAAVDLDHCVDPETGMVDPWAESSMPKPMAPIGDHRLRPRACASSASASGPEVHRKFTFDRETGAGLELYRNTARYITISGREIGMRRAAAARRAYRHAADAL